LLPPASHGEDGCCGSGTVSGAPSDGCCDILKIRTEVRGSQRRGSRAAGCHAYWERMSERRTDEEDEDVIPGCRCGGSGGEERGHRTE